MRQQTVAEQLLPFEVLPGRELEAGRPLVARLSGRHFDRLLDTGGFERPFDPRFGKAMVKTLSHLMSSLGCTFGFAERTELSLYAVAQGGDARRLLCRLAGEASAKLSLAIGQVATFDARLYTLPDVSLAYAYFSGRQEAHADAALDRCCGAVLGNSGADQSAVPHILDGLGADEKLELLRQNSFDYDALPAWQRRGASVRLRPADPTAEPAESVQARLVVDLQLPELAEFGEYLRRSLDG